ncbi:hydrogenase maturation carbamoyltransferase HypF [Azorhizobium sp. AG788]|uniref:carbamoyltransferase HypF n=1 Tax=Azorhizobium sp. AG788 TaxID=2183897 RepID=UPI00105FBF81|nr:carbamoyltransferase HypF [Azorhizobium sp. AG788]TDT96387.1 hydrogenase maturation carbamoyltransferase HypF [Azorhizobium sp. AG788]
MERTGEAEEITVRGIVQGVGFRPFVWRLARRFGLAGSVSNTGDAVRIHLAGPAAAREAFAVALVAEAPPLARVEQVTRVPAAPVEGAEFNIAESGAGAVSVGIVPDLATCSACRAEIADPKARRFRYAFTNCTDCGPRFSIVEGLPYDRPRTTMRAFALCPDCRREYDDPADRRFHAQPIACPACGPRLRFGALEGDAALAAAASALKAGAILAVKGIGGFHIACDATREAVVADLRRRKQRPTKPLAVMVADLAAARALAEVSELEAEALSDPSAPIVLLRRHLDGSLAPSVAPRQSHVGLMLAYTPLHHLLLAGVGGPLVMTSANKANAPQVFRDEDAETALAGIVDGLLTHNRPIARRLEDGVVRVAAKGVRVMRRGRGQAPRALDWPADFEGAPPILALGSDLKSAACLSHGRKALLTHHLGDLDTPAVEEEFARALADMAEVFAHHPEAVAVDLHPGYRATQFGTALAAERGLPLLAIPHHHAHIAATLAENGWLRSAGPVVGLALDGLGFGEDGTLWGAEVLVCDYRESRRMARLAPIALAGGDVASREPWRALLAHLDAAVEEGGFPANLLDGKPLATVRAMIAKGLNAPLASSAGRLFDAMAALLGLAPDRLSFEGEAAMALEACAGDIAAAPYPMAVREADGLMELDPAPLWRAALADRAAGVPAPAMAARFHAGVAAAFADLAAWVAEGQGLSTVALSGGVFQNARLLDDVAARLSAHGLTVLLPGDVPANDGGLAFGQAAIAAARLMASEGR